MVGLAVLASGFVAYFCPEPPPLDLTALVKCGICKMGTLSHRGGRAADSWGGAASLQVQWAQMVGLSTRGAELSALYTALSTMP